MDVNGLIAIIFFFTSLMVIGGSAIIGRHRERMGMIEKGMKAEDIKAMFGRSFREPHPLTSLKWGIIFVGIGLAVLLGLFLHSAYNMEGGHIPWPDRRLWRRGTHPVLLHREPESSGLTGLPIQYVQPQRPANPAGLIIFGEDT
jgi:hypothetical protein